MHSERLNFDPCRKQKVWDQNFGTQSCLELCSYCWSAEKQFSVLQGLYVRKNNLINKNSEKWTIKDIFHTLM